MRWLQSLLNDENLNCGNFENVGCIPNQVKWWQEIPCECISQWFLFHPVSNDFSIQIKLKENFEMLKEMFFIN